MIWLGVFVLSVFVLAPLAWALRRAAPARDRREAALALHRAQLAELERDVAEGRVGTADHDAARLEIQRRLLAADATDEPVARTGGSVALLALIPLIGLGGFLLYAASGTPQMPAQPLAERIAAAARQDAEADALIAELRRRLAELDPRAPQRRQGFEMLGSAEAKRGRMAEAATAWRTALATGFDPTLAAMTGAAIFQAEGKVTDEAAGLFRRALAEAPPDAPWRPMAEKMLQRVGSRVE